LIAFFLSPSCADDGSQSYCKNDDSAAYKRMGARGFSYGQERPYRIEDRLDHGGGVPGWFSPPGTLMGFEDFFFQDVVRENFMGIHGLCSPLRGLAMASTFARRDRVENSGRQHAVHHRESN
jgi:hypothetical protein